MYKAQKSFLFYRKFQYSHWNLKFLANTENNVQIQFILFENVSITNYDGPISPYFHEQMLPFPDFASNFLHISLDNQLWLLSNKI